MKSRREDVQLNGEVQIDQLFCHKIGALFHLEQAEIFCRQQWVFGAREEAKKANGLHKTVLYCVEDRKAETIGALLRKHLQP